MIKLDLAEGALVAGDCRVIGPAVRAVERALLRAPWLAQLYMAPYKGVVEKEIELAQLKPGEKVLQIGAGSIPFSAVYLARLARVFVCAIDIDRQAVERARRWTRELQLEAQIEVEYGDGKDFPLAGFSAAFVALQAEPKAEIITHLLTAGQPGFRVVARQPRASFRSQYSEVPRSWPNKGEVRQTMVTFSSSLLFVKEGLS